MKFIKKNGDIDFNKFYKWSFNDMTKTVQEHNNMFIQLLQQHIENTDNKIKNREDK